MPIDCLTPIRIGGDELKAEAPGCGVLIYGPDFGNKLLPSAPRVANCPLCGARSEPWFERDIVAEG